MIELEEFLDFTADERNFKTEGPMKRLTAQWNKRYPSAKVDDIVVWDNVTTNRAVLLEKMSDKFITLWGSKDRDKDKEKGTRFLWCLQTQGRRGGVVALRYAPG